MVKNVNIAQNLGYLKVPEGLLIKPHDIGLLPADRVAILSTGSQGEPLSALGAHRFAGPSARGDHEG